MEVVELPRESKKDEVLVEKMIKNIKKTGASVELDNINFTYMNSDKNVLHNANIEANPGEIIALVGPSGEGKSTTMRLILGLTNPGQGRAIIRDTSGLECDISASTRKLMAYVPQEKTMFSGTIAENMRLVKVNKLEFFLVSTFRMKMEIL